MKIDWPACGEDRLAGMRRHAFLTAALTSIAGSAQAHPARLRQRTGANCFNRRVTPRWVEAAARADIGLVRLSYEKWDDRDFLLLYALGAEPAPGWYWHLADEGGLPEHYDELNARRRNNALWRVLRGRLGTRV
jgi:hypothetical protein